MFEFWLKNETKSEDMLLPVTPEGYEISTGMEIETVRATNLGDINVAGRRKPKSITISSFFPARDYPFVRKGSILLGNAAEYVKKLEQWKDAKDIIRLVIADNGGARVNEQFYIEDITSGERKEDNGDITYTINLRQYTPMKVSAIAQAPAANTPRTDTKTAAPKKTKTYTVKRGDCLSAIARQVYGDANQWRKIYEANKSVIGKNPNLIFPGQTYTIP